MMFLLLPGCGYTLNHRLRDVFSDKRGIFVPVFNNKSDETGAERVFTNAIIRELQSRGEIVFKAREEGALELTGTIGNIQVTQTAASGAGFAGLAPFRKIPLEVGILVTMTLQLRDNSKNSILWANSFQTYRTVATPVDRTFSYQAPSALGAATQSLVESTYADIARDMMRDVYDDMVELF